MMAHLHKSILCSPWEKVALYTRKWSIPARAWQRRRCVVSTSGHERQCEGQNSLQKRTSWRTHTSWFENSHKSAVIRTRRYLRKDRHVDGGNRIESPEVNPCIYLVNWFLTRVPRPFNWKSIISSINGAGTIGELHAKGWSWTFPCPTYKN